MNTTNVYKIRTICESLIKDRLITIFKDRWFTENNNEFISNSQNGRLLALNYPKSAQSIVFSDKISKFEDFDELNKKLLENGTIELLDFPIIAHILLNSNYIKVNNETKSTQNEILKSICEFYKAAFESYFFFDINDQLDLQGIQTPKILSNLERIKQLFKDLETSITSQTKRRKTNFNSLDEEIEYRLNTLQSDVHNTDNDKKAMELKDKGNKCFTMDEFEKAEQFYNKALEIGDLSSYTKSILHSNLSKTYLQMTNNQRAYKSSNKNLAQHAHMNATYAAINRPMWSTIYYTLARCLYKINALEDAARHSLAACYLYPASNEFKLYSDTLVKHVADKHQIAIENHGKRNYDAEATLRIQELGNLIQVNYGGKLLTKEWCHSIDPTVNARLESEANLGYVPIKTLYEKHFYVVALDAYNKMQDDRAIEIFSRCIGNGTDTSMAYQLLGLILSDKVHYNLKQNKSLMPLILSLFLQGSLFPLTNNYGLVFCYSELGRIYKNGLYEEPIDAKKAKHYLKLAIKLNNGKPDFKNLDNMAFHHLGQQYLNDRKIDKAKKLLFKGALLGDPHCYAILNLDFPKTPQNQDVTNFLSNRNNQFNKSILGY